MVKTTHNFDWVNGYIIRRRLSRSFETLEEAEGFAKGKDVVDIYMSKGLYKVEWAKTIRIIEND